MKKAKPSLPIGVPTEGTLPVDDSAYIKFGLLFLLLSLGGFSLWAGFAPLGSALITHGEVVVNSYKKSIQHYEGGIVKNIYVKNGDKVSAGAPLIQLETTQQEAQQINNKKRLYSTQAELERLQAEQQFKTTVTFNADLVTESKHDPDVKNAIDQQLQLFNARLSAFSQERNALLTRIDQTRQQISGLTQQLAIIQQQTTSLKKEQQAYATLFKEGLGDGLRARELDRSVLSNQNEMAKIKSEISRLKIQITETDLQIATRKQDYLKEIGEKIREAQNNYYDYQENLQITNDRIKRALIRAPEAGVVIDMQIHTIGSVVTTGQTLLSLVPANDTFVVEAKLNTRDINDVYTGQRADIRFSAFNTQATKVIEGEVINVSADRLIDKRDQTPYYMARIKITKQGLADMGDSMDLKPGMPAEVMIRREDRTLFEYLIKPIADSFARSFKEK